MASYSAVQQAVGTVGDGRFMATGCVRTRWDVKGHCQLGNGSRQRDEENMMHKFAAALLMALLIGAAVPAQAQSFGIFFGDEPSDFLLDDEASERVPELAMCLNDNQIREAIAAEGFSDIALNAPNEKHIQVRASRDGTVYLLNFNFCTGRIEEQRPLRAVK